MRDCCIDTKGFISTYFLAGFLLCSILVTSSMYIDRHIFQSFSNLKENNQYFEQEVLIIEHIKKELLESELLEPSTYTYGNVYCDIEVEEEQIIVDVYSPQVETLVILYDQEDKKINDFTSYRS